MLVDYERGWLALKKYVVEKKSHGQRDLLRKMTDIEIECEVEEPGFDPGPVAQRNGKRSTEGEPQAQS